MADPVISPTIPTYINTSTAPFVVFDVVAAHGVLNGAVQIELAGRTLIPKDDGTVGIEIVAAARLRCSPAAAIALRDAINGALEMLQQPSEPTPVASALN